MTSKIAIYCLLLVAVIGLVSAAHTGYLITPAPQNGVEYGYEVECVETTYHDGSAKSEWSISGNKIRLPSGWRQIGSAASSIPGDGKFSSKYVWYQLDQSAPARGAGGGKLCGNM